MDVVAHPGISRPARHRRGIALGVLAILGSLGACSSPAESPMADSTPTPAPSAPPPNLVVILADDLDVPTTKELPLLPDLMASRGLSFDRAFVATPLCAPSRASILTGQYTHNHGMVGNGDPVGGFVLFREFEESTLATWLHDAGYRTSLIGKYLNGYPAGAPSSYIPPGWDDWYGHLAAFEDDKYYNYFINDNGQVTWHGAEPEDYSTDAVAQRAVEFVHDSAGRSEPLFLYVAVEAPHTPATYAARHGGEFGKAGAPRVPSYNEPDMADKPWAVRRDPLSPAQLQWLDGLQRARLRSMRAVEELIAKLRRALNETGRLGNTYIFFTSDNGLLMGQHRIAADKRYYYEEAIRVPLMVRGPGVEPGRTNEIVVNIDLAPTLLELAGAPVPDSIDGRSFAPLLRGERPATPRSAIVVEIGLNYALRTPEWAYIENQFEQIELYDMRRDPYQIESLHREADPALLEDLHEQLRALLRCRGEDCRR